MKLLANRGDEDQAINSKWNHYATQYKLSTDAFSTTNDFLWPHRIGASPKMPDNLPNERDFDPHGCGLDEQCAWRNFGGLTLDEACKKFASTPEVYQEDFMFMGSKAFAFYYPVIDRFLRNTITLTDEERGYRQSWILPQCIRAQFDEANRESVVRLKASVLALCKFMLENIDCFKDDWEVPSEIEMQWRSLQLHVDRF